MAVSNVGPPTDINPLLQVAAEFRQFNEAAEARAARTDEKLTNMTATLVRLTYVLLIVAVLSMAATVTAALR